MSSGAPAPSSSARALIEQRERELHETTQSQLAHLEAALQAREREVDALRARLAALKEDYAHNLRLFAERDADIERLEAQLAAAQLREREAGAAADALRVELGKRTGRSSVPNIFIGGASVGGFSDGPGVNTLQSEGKLVGMLKSAGAM